MTNIFAFAALLFGFIVPSLQGYGAIGDTFEVPALTGAVVDQAGILSSGTQQEVERVLTRLVESGGSQIQVVTLPSLAGLSIEEVGIKLADAWKIGHKGQDDGVIFIVAPKDRRIRIEVGKGREGELTDALSRRIINEVVTPLFKQQNFDDGIRLGVAAIINVTDPGFDTDTAMNTGSYNGQRRLREGQKPVGGIFKLFLIIIIFGLFLILRLFQGLSGFGPRSRGRYGSGYWGGGGGGFGGGSSWGGGGGGFSGGGSSGSW